jgi:CDP-diacylglycerol---serine O-phosphatidyltransferase
MISMLKRLKFADFFTIGNFVCGIMAIILAINENFLLSAIIMLCAVMFDTLDGKIARYFNQQNEMGKELDSLADIVSFGIWPAIFGYQLGLNSYYAIIILVFFSVCGMLRLARFNVTDIKHFEGLPITANGLVFPAVYFIFWYNNLIFNEYILLLYLFMAIFMVSSLRIRKI